MGKNPSRRTVIVSSGLLTAGLAGCMGTSEEGDDGTGSDDSGSGGGNGGSGDDENGGGDDNPSSNEYENTIVWDGQGGERFGTLDCEENEVGYWKWILTPGGPTPIEEGALLTVTFEDSTDVEAEGYRPGGGGGAVHFDVFKDGGGTVESAEVSFDGGNEDRSVLTISEARCVPEENDVDPKLDVKTKDPTDVNKSTATLNGKLVRMDGYETVKVYFEWRNVEDEEWQTTPYEELEAPGSFSAEIDGLEPGGQYEFRAVAEANSERVVGATLFFEKDDKDHEKKQPDVKNDVHLKAVCYDYHDDNDNNNNNNDDNGKKAKFAVYNDTKHDLKFSWRAKNTEQGGKLTVPSGDKKYIWVKNADKSTYLKLYFDDKKIHSAKANVDDRCNND